MIDEDKFAEVGYDSLTAGCTNCGVWTRDKLDNDVRIRPALTLTAPDKFGRQYYKCPICFGCYGSKQIATDIIQNRESMPQEFSDIVDSEFWGLLL